MTSTGNAPSSSSWAFLNSDTFASVASPWGLLIYLPKKQSSMLTRGASDGSARLKWPSSLTLPFMQRSHHVRAGRCVSMWVLNSSSETWSGIFFALGFPCIFWNFFRGFTYWWERTFNYFFWLGVLNYHFYVTPTRWRTFLSVGFSRHCFGCWPHSAENIMSGACHIMTSGATRIGVGAL